MRASTWPRGTDSVPVTHSVLPVSGPSTTATVGSSGSTPRANSFCITARACSSRTKPSTARAITSPTPSMPVSSSTSASLSLPSAAATSADSRW